MARLFAGLFFSPAAFSYTKIFSILTKNGKSTADKQVVRGSKVLVLASHAGLKSRSKSGYERDARVINSFNGPLHIRDERLCRPRLQLQSDILAASLCI